MTAMGRIFVLVVSILTCVPAAAQEARVVADPTGRTVRDFGALCDGKSDDTQALWSAAAAVPETGGRLRFPQGATCRAHATIYIHSHTFVEGNGATLLAIQPWISGKPEGAYAILENINHDAARPTDTDISVDGMTLDYGDFGPVLKPPAGGAHAIRFMMASNLAVTNSVFRLRGAEDAIAGVGVHNMRVEGNTALEFRNCAYDFWAGSSDVRVIGNYAETSRSAQMVNFNPEGPSKGMHAENFVLANNILKSTSSLAIGVQIEPLGSGTTLANVVVNGNILQNVYLVLRRAITGASIVGNTISGLRGGSEAIVSYPLDGGTPDGIVVAGNTIVNPTTAKGLGVIRVEAKNFAVTGNVISGEDYIAPGIYTGAFKGVVAGNWVSSGRMATPHAVADIGSVQLANAKGLTLQDTASAPAQIVVQADNNLVLYGTNAKGAQRPILSIYQDSNVTPLRITVPLSAEAGLHVKLAAPTSANAACSPGEIRAAETAIYVCTSPNTWKSAHLAPD